MSKLVIVDAGAEVRSSIARRLEKEGYLDAAGRCHPEAGACLSGLTVLMVADFSCVADRHLPDGAARTTNTSVPALATALVSVDNGAHPVLRAGELVMDRLACRVLLKGRPLHVTATEYRLLELFLSFARQGFPSG